MVGLRQSQALHIHADPKGQPLSAPERESLLRSYLPRDPSYKKRASSASSSSSVSANCGSRFHHRQRVRHAVRQMIYSLLFNLIHIFFSLYLRLRQIYHALIDRVLAVLYYHHRTPELIKKDVKGLSRKPQHLSVILDLPPAGGKTDALETLLHDACELAAWSASAGVPMLSIYEQTGILKSSLPHLHRRINRTLISYYGASSPSRPTISLRSPNLSSYSPPYSPDPDANDTHGDMADPPHHLTILLLDATDGRQTLVDLTKTLAEMSQRGKLSPSDVSQDLIDAEISETVMGEPDLLVIFGPRVILEGYPPWQVRLTEIVYAQDNVGGVGYQVFLKALYKYAEAEFRFGR